MFYYFYILFKVWQGEYECKPITYSKCELVSQTQKFNQTTTRCEGNGNEKVPFVDFSPSTVTFSLTKTYCEPVDYIDCRSVSKSLCQTVDFVEHIQTVQPACEFLTVWYPEELTEPVNKC